MQEKYKLNGSVVLEFKYLLGIFIIVYVILQIAFFKEGIYTILRLALALFYLFILPGYAIMLHYDLDFIERLIGGCLICLGILIPLAYYSGLLGLHIEIFSFVMPLIIIAVGIAINKKKIFLQEIKTE